MKKYAELHSNVQMYRIKSRYGNKMSLALATSMKESLNFTNPMAKFAESSKEIFVGLDDQYKQISGVVKGVGDMFNKEQVFGRKLPHYKVICNCASG